MMVSLFKLQKILYMILEIAVTSLLSARRAEAGGADRVELCMELGVGGLTPSPGLLEEVLNALSIPVNVLIRPRSGDFTYTDYELQVMEQDIRYCKSVGCAGIVSGVLMDTHEIDQAATERLIEASGDLPFTFHRAFDWTSNFEQSIDTLLAMGVKTVLSSGQEPQVIAGLETLQRMQLRAGDALTVMPGGGVTPDNASIFAQAGFRALHASASQIEFSWSESFPFSFNSAKHINEQVRYESNTGRIQAIKRGCIL